MEILISTEVFVVELPLSGVGGVKFNIGGVVSIVKVIEELLI